jgi:hypothetical protein
MWKPGSEKPEASSMEIPSTTMTTTTTQTQQTDASGKSPPTSTTPRKRLSSGTMNMKFMKRKKEIHEQQQLQQLNNNRRKSGGGCEDNDINNSNVVAHRQQQSQEENSAIDMDIYQQDDSTTPMKTSSTFQKYGDDDEPYGQATSMDMYGIQGSLIGRRSFRGFNPAMERAWNDSKASLENRADGTTPREKISDEELLRRYQNIAKSRNGGAGKRDNTVGNLDKKTMKTRKKQELR